MQTTQRNRKSTIAVVLTWPLLVCLSLVSAGCGAGNATPTPTASMSTATPLETATSIPPTNTPEIEPAPTETPQLQGNQWNQVGSDGHNIQDMAIAQEGGSVLATGPMSVWLGLPDDYEEWQQISVPITGGTTSAAIGNKGQMFVTSHNGCASGLPMSLQRSTDGGSTWQEITSPALPLQIAMIGDSLAYGASCGGVVRSTDSGNTWSVLPGAGVMNFDPQSVVASPDGQTLYVSYVSEGGTGRIQRSTDRGSTWNDITPQTASGNPPNAVSNLTFVQGPDTTSGLFMTSAQGLWFLSPTDGNWKLVSSLEPNIHFSALALDMTAKGEIAAIYAAKSEPVLEPEQRPGLGVFRTTDGGATWEQVGDDLGRLLVKKLLLIPSSTGNLLLAATDQGGIWAMLTSP